MSADAEARLAALVAEVELQLHASAPHLPPVVRGSIARALAWLKWRWEADVEAALAEALAPSPPTGRPWRRARSPYARITYQPRDDMPRARRR
jgi:hypothetical protein